MILLHTNSSIPLSSSSKATSSQSGDQIPVKKLNRFQDIIPVQILFFKSLINGPSPGSVELYGLP